MSMSGSWTRPRRVCYALPLQYGSGHVECYPQCMRALQGARIKAFQQNANQDQATKAGQIASKTLFCLVGKRQMFQKMLIEI